MAITHVNLISYVNFNAADTLNKALIGSPESAASLWCSIESDQLLGLLIRVYQAAFLLLLLRKTISDLIFVNRQKRRNEAGIDFDRVTARKVFFD